jgi:predicted nucleotidyltransferase
MTQEKYQKAMDNFVRRALEKHGDKIESIILFGSVARGEAREDSDIDILLITSEDPFKMQKLISKVVVKILLETGM